MRAIDTWPLPLFLLANPAIAQEQVPAPTEAAAPADEGSETVAPPEQRSAPGELVVVAERLRGQIETQQAPIATLNEEDISALGVSSIGELVSRVSPQTGSGRGRGDGMPVLLVNGQRITNFREMRNFPPEAVQRVEILPEETAQRFGFPPDSRVINLILKKKFRSFAIEEGGSFPTRGGFVAGSLEASLTRVAGLSRFSLTGNVNASSPLFEYERDVIQAPGNVSAVAADPEPARFRTLLGQTRNYGLNLAWTRGYGKDGMGGTLTLSAAANRVDSHSWQGLNTVRLVAPGGASALRTLADPLEQFSHITTLQAGAGYNRQLGRWQLTATVDATHVENRSLTDRRADTSGLTAAALDGTLPITGSLPVLPSAGQDAARSKSNRVESLVILIGRPMRLPGGQVTTTFKGGLTWIGFESSDQRSLSGPVSLERFRVLGGINVVLPLTSRRENFGSGIGDLTLNVSADVAHLSDFGGTNGWSTGLTWAPVKTLNLQASYIVNQSAPSISQLGNPVTTIVNFPVYDFARGETALISITTGGNPLLRKEQQRDLKFGLNWQLPVLTGSNLVVEYFRNRSDNVTASFPLLTPAIEAAYPGRVTRDGAGRLVSIDQRAVTFFRQDGSRLRWGFNLSAPFGQVEGIAGPAGPPPPRPAAAAAPAPPPGGGAAPRGGPPRGGARGGGGGMGMMGGPTGQPGRWSLGVYHTVQFTSRVLVAPGGPTLDLLDGDSLSTAGTPRHSIELNGGVFYKGFGLFTQGSWSAGTTVEASGLPGTSDLRFGSVTNLNLFVFLDFSQRPKLIKKIPFLKGARVTLRVENLFDSHARVTDGTGTIPISYQADYLDPRGRMIGFSLRKMF